MGHGQNECTVCGKRFGNYHSREECMAWVTAQSDDGLRALYPAIHAVFGPQFAAGGTPMPATFDDLAPEAREQFRLLVATASKGGK